MASDIHEISSRVDVLGSPHEDRRRLDSPWQLTSPVLAWGAIRRTSVMLTEADLAKEVVALAERLRATTWLRLQELPDHAPLEVSRRDSFIRVSVDRDLIPVEIPPGRPFPMVGPSAQTTFKVTGIPVACVSMDAARIVAGYIEDAVFWSVKMDRLELRRRLLAVSAA